MVHDSSSVSNPVTDKWATFACVRIVERISPSSCAFYFLFFTFLTVLSVPLPPDFLLVPLLTVLFKMLAFIIEKNIYKCLSLSKKEVEECVSQFSIEFSWMEPWMGEEIVFFFSTGNRISGNKLYSFQISIVGQF